MLTKVRIRNFKLFEDVEIELGQNVVLVGPNNSGKTSVLQALALWEKAIGEYSLIATIAADPTSEEKSINRLAITNIPIPVTELLWRNRKTNNDQKRHIQIAVKSMWNNREYTDEINFLYSNPESISYHLEGENYFDLNEWANFSVRTSQLNIEFLAPISGLIAVEPYLQPGRINVLIGEGRTAEVLRNLCYRVYEDGQHWNALVSEIRRLFGVEILPPEYLVARGEIRMSYRDQNSVLLDLSAAGRGMLQILLLLAYMYNNPGAVLLLDEPDAHLEILRQRQVYNLLTDIARQQGAQIIATTHSEVLLTEAYDRDIAVAMLGTPHRIDNNNKSQVEKALTAINATDYYQAEQTGWVLYLEGATDLAILREFARRLGHKAVGILDSAFVHYLNTNQPQAVRDHFYGLREAVPNLGCVALFDRLDKLPTDNPAIIRWQMWRKREIENYLTLSETLYAYARYDLPDNIFSEADRDHRETVMRAVIADVTQALDTLGKPSPWSDDVKASDDFLNAVFRQYFDRLNLPNLMNKTDYHSLVQFVPIEKIDPEVTEKLNVIVEVARQAHDQNPLS